MTRATPATELARADPKRDAWNRARRARITPAPVFREPPSPFRRNLRRYPVRRGRDRWEFFVSYACSKRMKQTIRRAVVPEPLYGVSTIALQANETNVSFACTLQANETRRRSALQTNGPPLPRPQPRSMTLLGAIARLRDRFPSRAVQRTHQPRVPRSQRSDRSVATRPTATRPLPASPRRHLSRQRQRPARTCASPGAR